MKKQSPISEHDRLEMIARETARMSFPGGMRHHIPEGAKRAIEEYFVHEFPLPKVWKDPRKIAKDYDGWHKKQTAGMVEALEEWRIKEAVAAKLLNTFMHQLMKYEECRPLWKELHLPLDGQVFKALKKKQGHFKSLVKLMEKDGILHKNPYSIDYSEYNEVQEALKGVVKELKLSSRIDLNWYLWAGL